MLLKIDLWLAALGLGVGMSLAGCAALTPVPLSSPEPLQVLEPTPPPPPVQALIPLPTFEVVVSPQQTTDAAVRHVLAYFERLRSMTTSELNQELGRLNQAPGGPATTLETALALAQSRSNGDLAQALSLLDSLLRINTPELMPWQPIARLLTVRLAEQRKLEEQLERVNAQLKDSQRDSQRKIDQLNEKLEALKAIERSLTVRQPALGASSAKTP